MPSRKVFSSGWHYWLAKHGELGLLLYDRANQDGVAPGNANVYRLATSSNCEISRDVLKGATADVTDHDFVKIVNSYNEFKLNNGMEIIAESHPASDQTEAKHAAHLERMGLSNPGVRKSNRPKAHRIAHCWSCKEELDNHRELECAGCGWIICECGACGCGRKWPQA